MFVWAKHIIAQWSIWTDWTDQYCPIKRLVILESKRHKREEETTLTPTGRRATKYFSSVLIVGIHHKPLGQRQFAFVRVKTDERCLAAVVHFCFVDDQTKIPKLTVKNLMTTHEKKCLSTNIHCLGDNGRKKMNTE